MCVRSKKKRTIIYDQYVMFNHEKWINPTAYGEQFSGSLEIWPPRLPKAHANSVSYVGQQGMESQQPVADLGFSHWSGIARVKLLLGKRNDKRIIGLKVMASSIWEAD